MSPKRQDGDKPKDERLANVLFDIANSIMSCIQMEEDWPSRNSDRKMPVLDITALITEKEYKVYQHYEKEISIKTVILYTPHYLLFHVGLPCVQIFGSKLYSP